MTKSDQLKIIKAGFTIIRADLFRMAIKTKKAVLNGAPLKKDLQARQQLTAV